MVSKDFYDKFFGAWWGAFIGDALAMPAHGYSTSELLSNDYGKISGYLAPHDFHPESVLHTLPVLNLPPQFDYIGPVRAKLWHKRGTHPHYGFASGENTLPMFLALHLVMTMSASNAFDLALWMERYSAIMTSEGVNRDTFIPSIHRRYFDNLSMGKNPELNGCADAHMSDVAIFIPLLFFTLKNSSKNQMDIFRALKKFTLGEGASSAAFFLSELLARILGGSTIEDAMYKTMTPDRHVSLAFPYRRWIKNKDDEQAITSTGRFAPIEEALPLSLFLALKYGANVPAALLVNANIGGETTGRGAIVGMLAGAQCGISKIPRNFIDGLTYSSEIQAVGELLYNMVR